ncbi:MAG: phosphatidylglycerophosphatase A [Deltaproteobacteria bacterium]|nr:phosphatidylglycerophosphatase A [Deltaproteobacteria bacterium]
MLITWFGCGLVPLAPGTAGSIGALPLCWALAMYAPLWVRLVVAIGVTAIAILGSAQDQLETATKDPQYIVIDEVAGMLWTTLLLDAQSPLSLGLGIGFVLFRIFDMTKPPPANLFDRASKTSPSTFRRGAHIVLDDVVAGLYSLAILTFILHQFRAAIDAAFNAALAR